MQVTLTPELEEHLRRQAARAGQSPDALAREAIRQYLEHFRPVFEGNAAEKSLTRGDTFTPEQVERVVSGLPLLRLSQYM